MDQCFEAHSLSWHDLVASFPPGSRRKNAENFLRWVDEIRELVRDKDREASYHVLFNQIRECLSGRESEHSLARQMAHIIEESAIPHQYIFDWVKGVHREAGTSLFLDFADLGTCAYLNSSAILLCLSRILVDHTFDEKIESSLIALGQADYLLHKMSNFVPQLENKKFFFPFCEIEDRGLDLSDQTQPIDGRLWKDLIQFQCRRILEHLALAEPLEGLPAGPFRKFLCRHAIRQMFLLKKIRRFPDLILREQGRLDWWDTFRARFYSWNSLSLSR